MEPTRNGEVLSDRDPNDGGGRTSRGSNKSGPSRSSGKTAPPASSSNFPALFGRGITCMLRTETELGDLGDIVFGNLSGTSSRQHHTQWHGALSSMSATSSMSNSSSRMSKPLPGYSSSSSAPRYLTAPNGPQSGANKSPLGVPSFPSSPLTGTIENRDRDPDRSQSTIHTVQSFNNLSADRSHTYLRHAQNLRPHNSYTHFASHRGGPGSSAPNNWSASSALCDNIGLLSQVSHNVEGQRPSTGGYSHTYANTGHPHSPRSQVNVGQEQLHRGLGQPHNLGQVRYRLAHQSSSRSVEDQRRGMDVFPPFDDTVCDERLDNMRTNKLQSRHNLSESRYTDRRSRAFALPASHKPYHAAEPVASKKFVADAVTSDSTYLHTNSDAVSFETTASRVSNDSKSIGVLRYPDDMEETQLKDAGSDLSNLCFPVGDSIPEITSGESTEKTTDKSASNPSVAAGLGQDKEDSVPGVPAGFLGDGSDVPIDELRGNDAPSDIHGNVSEYAVTSMNSRMRSSPLVTQVMDDHARKSLNEQSFRSRRGIPDESLGPARFESGKDCKGYPASTPNTLLQRGENIVDPDTYSGLPSKGATSSDCAGLRLLSQNHLLNPNAKAIGNTRINPGVHSPRSAVVRKPLPVYPTPDHFPCLFKESCETCAGTSSESVLRNCQADTRLGRGRVALGVGVGPHHAPRRSATGVGSHHNSLAPTQLTDIQEDSIQEDSATDLELSRHQRPGPSRYPRDLKESEEGFNTQSVFDAQSNFQASGEDLANASRSPTVSRRLGDTDSNASNIFTRSRGLPLMQPTQVDLSDGLPSKVGLCHSRSVEQLPHVSHRLNRGCPPRAVVAAEVHRQRISLAEVEDVELTALSMQPNATIGLLEIHRAYSPELMVEIEGSTVPSVGGPAQSLSESSSSLKKTCKRGESAERPVEEEVDRTPPTQQRSSARLGSVPDIPHVVPEDAAKDELERRGKNNSEEKERNVSACIGGDVAAIGASGADAVEMLEKGNSTRPTQTHHSTAPPTNPQAVSSAVTRRRSNAFHTQNPRYSSVLTLPPSRSSEPPRNATARPNSQIALPSASRGRSSALHTRHSHCSSDFTLPSRRSSRSLTSTSQVGETQLCNPDTNCTSAVSTNTEADTFLPHSAVVGHPPHSRVRHIRNRLSEASGTTAFSTAQTVTASLSRPPADNTARAPTDHLNSFGRTSNQPHEAGERYPTSDLSPPTAIFRDQLCVSDTEDDDIHDITHEARDPLCKRILTACDNTYYKLALRASRVQPSPEWFEPSATRVAQDRAHEARELTASVEVKSYKQRHPKTWWQKSSRLIRQLSARKSSSNNNG